ncbi:MAG: hypothetical protein ACXADY_18420 [Candidatus Hodarchaeales archaeon]|jgi:hypothetical protein
MSTQEDHNRLKIPEDSPYPPLIPFVISLFMITGRFRERRKKF